MRDFGKQYKKAPSDASSFAPACFCARFVRVIKDMTVLVMSIFVLLALARISLLVLVFSILVLLLIIQLNTCRANGFKKAPATS